MYNAQMHVILFFDHYFNCFSFEINISKSWLKLICSQGSKAFKTQIASALLAILAKSFWDWCHFNSIWKVFEVTCWHFSILGFLTDFREFWVFVFGYRAQNEKPEITKNLYFRVYNAPIHVDLCFDHYFRCLSVKTGIQKNGLNLIYPEGSKALKPK